MKRETLPLKYMIAVNLSKIIEIDLMSNLNKLIPQRWKSKKFNVILPRSALNMISSRLILFFFSLFSFSRSAVVRFECNEFDNQRLEKYRTTIQKIISENDLESLGVFLAEFDPFIYYSRFKELESILKSVLVERKYEIAEQLIKKGNFRLQSCISAHIKMMIGQGVRIHSLIQLLISTHVQFFNENISPEDFSDFLEEALKYKDAFLFEYFWNFKVREELSVNLLLRLAKRALHNMNRNTIDRMFADLDESLSRIILRGLIKICITEERFFIIQMCAEKGIGYMALTFEERYEILQLAATCNCTTTTKFILNKRIDVVPYLKERYNDFKAPWMMALRRGFHEVYKLYQERLEIYSLEDFS